MINETRQQSHIVHHIRSHNRLSTVHQQVKSAHKLYLAAQRYSITILTFLETLSNGFSARFTPVAASAAEATGAPVVRAGVVRPADVGVGGRAAALGLRYRPGWVILQLVLLHLQLDEVGGDLDTRRDVLSVHPATHMVICWNNKGYTV